MKANRTRSKNIKMLAALTLILGALVGFGIGVFTAVKVNRNILSGFNWTNAAIIFGPALAAGMILLGIAQLAALGEEKEIKSNDSENGSIKRF